MHLSKCSFIIVVIIINICLVVILLCHHVRLSRYQTRAFHCHQCFQQWSMPRRSLVWSITLFIRLPLSRSSSCSPAPKVQLVNIRPGCASSPAVLFPDVGRRLFSDADSSGRSTTGYPSLLYIACVFWPPCDVVIA